MFLSALLALSVNATGIVRYVDEQDFNAASDTERLQKALTFCSINNAVCVVPAGKNMW